MLKDTMLLHFRTTLLAATLVGVHREAEGGSQ